MLVVLLAPMRARADLWYFYGGGGTDPGGDPDQPGPGDDRVSPGIRLHGGDGNDVRRPSNSYDQKWMRRYLMLLSGLRSYYLRF
jgi:hypothetical protein